MTDGADKLRDAIGIVAIGRNEGQRLRRCLESALDGASVVVYVDSGSTDGSVELARSLGVDVVELDMSTPFTAARARNAGIARLKEIKPKAEFVQVVDGDCEIIEGWIDRALDKMDAHDDVAVVCGRRRERYPDASRYNRLCDMEWNTAIGEAEACGGDALMRLDALFSVGCYDPSLIAGEEPELCLRLRREGWRILRIDNDMTLHDAQMTQFNQWWRRSIRAGYAYAEGRAMHGDSPQRYRVQEIRSIIEWAILLPAVALTTAWFTYGASLLLFAGYVVLWYRVRGHRLAAGDSPADAVLYARYCMLGKFAMTIGVGRYWLNRLQGRRSTLIEYKGTIGLQTESNRTGGALRILYVGGVLPARSETFVYRELLALRDLGIDVQLASVHEPERELGDERVNALADEAIRIYSDGQWRVFVDAMLDLLWHPVHALAVLLRGICDALFSRDVTMSRRPKVIWQCLAGLALSRRLRGREINHIHAHMAHVPTTISMYCAMRLGVPFSFTGHAVDIFRHRTLLEAKLRRASMAMCISHWHRSFYKKILPLPDERLPIVRCGVDVKAFAPAEESRNEDDMRVLSVGRLVEKKGYDVLIKAIAALVDGAQQVTCRIVGDGPMRGRLDGMRRECNVADRVMLLGAQDNERVRELLLESDLFVLPCKIDPTGDRDGIPVVLMEAMACGVCAVSGDLPAIRELITDGESGVLVQPGSGEAPTDAMRSLIDDGQRRRALAKAGRQRVVEEYSLSANIERLRGAILSVHGLQADERSE